MISYIKDYQSFAQTLRSNPEEPSIRNGHILQNFYRTKKEIVQQVLPPPLQVPDDPQVYVYHSYWAQPAFGNAYYESAQFVRANYQGREGWYLLAMYVNEDVSLWIGREVFGLPKRMAEVKLERKGDMVWGTTTRRGIKIIAAEMEIKEEQPHDKHMETWTTKWSLNSNAKLEYAKLLSLPYRVDDKESHVGNGSVTYEASDSDPTQQLEVVEPLMCWYMVHDMYRGPASEIVKFKPDTFYPHLTARMIG